MLYLERKNLIQRGHGYKGSKISQKIQYEMYRITENRIAEYRNHETIQNN